MPRQPLAALSPLLALLLITVGAHANDPPGGRPAAFRDDASPMDDLYRARLEPQSADVLSVTLLEAAQAPDALRPAGQYSIQSPDDPAYAPDKSVKPRSVGLHRRLTRLSDRFDLMVKPTTIFLALPAPMKPGCTYRVVADAIDPAIAKLPPVSFDDRNQLNDAIRTNHLGYLPGRAKRAYVGQYMGDAGPMPITARRFEILDPAGTACFTGDLVRRQVGEELVGQELWEADFTPFDRAGTYRVRIAGMGVSMPFAIGPDAYNPALGNLMRGNYHQRCGEEIPEAWSRFGRPACHLDDALLGPEAAKLKFVAPKNPPLYEADLSVRQRTCVHGHHDAGDYGKYTTSGAGYVFAILHAMEVFPDRFGEDTLGLPCSGNGIPDLLDEAKWELDWLASMQDTDGGVFGVIRPKTGGYENHLPPAKNGRLLFPKDTAFTGSYAAALAKAARSPLVRKHFPREAADYLERARKAWAWLEKNPRFTQYFHYGAIFGDQDERCWAAAELFLATGEAPFAQYLQKNFDPAQRRWGWWALFEAQGYAVMSIVAGPKSPGDDLLARCKAELKTACDALVAQSDANPYRLSFPPSSVQHKSFGWFFPGEMAGYPLLMGFRASGDARYLQCALDNMSYSMGTNASGHFLFSGLGHKRNAEVVHDPSKHDDIAEPSPGIPLGIGSSGLYYLSRYGKRAGEGQHPNEWPLLNRWYDGFNVQTEFTTPQLAKETIVAAYFASVPRHATAPPTIVIRTRPEANAGGYRLKFDLDVKGGGEVRQVFWDFDDESFSSAPAPVHTFADPGRRYRVAATVVDANGQWAWSEALVVAPLVNPKYRREPLASGDALARFAFDGNLDDAGGKLHLAPRDSGVFRRPFRFEPAVASWMARPTGQVLALHGNEQFTITLPDDARSALFEKGLFIDTMVYMDEFVTRGFPGDPVLLGVKQKWDAWAGLQHGTWDREATPTFKGGKGVIVPAADVSAALPRRRWCQVRMELSPARGCQLLIDGQPVGKPGAFTFAASARDPLILSAGPWRGMLDDLVVGRLK